MWPKSKTKPRQYARSRPPEKGGLAAFLGLDPRGLTDRYADYFQQNVAHTLINYEHCVRNPHGFKGYGPDCWGLTSSDDHLGYHGHAQDRDLGVITPTAALASFPNTPEHSMAALRHFYHRLGERIWDEYGFVEPSARPMIGTRAHISRSTRGRSS